MVTTRRNAAAPAESSQAAAADQSLADGTAPSTQRSRPGKRPSRKATTAMTTTASTSQQAQQSTIVTTATTTSTSTTTSRRLRSKPTASPLKSLEEEPKRNATKSSTQKASAPKDTPKNKRKRNIPRNAAASASATPEPENVNREQDGSNDDQGIFFTQNDDNVMGAEISQLAGPSTPSALATPTYAQFFAVHSSPHVRSPDELTVLRYENIQLCNRIDELEQINVNLVHLNGRLEHQLYMFRTGQVKTNQAYSDLNTFGLDGIDSEEGLSIQPEFIRGDESALALLHKIESAAREPRIPLPHSESESTMIHSQNPANQNAAAETPRPTSESTPSRIISTPSSFFSRSFSAIKSKLGFSTSTPPPQPASASATPRVLPPPDTVTEWLSTPPTPVGERGSARPKKTRQNPMLKLLLRGVAPEDKKAAEAWAKNVIPTLKNDAAFADKRKRLETPVLFQDLEHFPPRKPWETAGFGDPLGELEDDDVVPVWAVYLDMLAEEEEPQHKKTKTTHDRSMDVEDTPSMNEIFGASGGPSTPSPYGLSGTASHRDLHPRRSVEPSPMFESSTNHQDGNNIFRELKGHDAAEQLRADKVNLQKETKTVVPHHDPSQGSFGLDYDSDDDDDTMLSGTSDAGAAPLWTQPPPPAPVPAHAPLPGGPSAEASSASAQQPVDEVERQRQKLMKHTPAKPSRLREAFVPSPSLMSDAGNDSVLIATPLPVAGLFGDMPGVEDLALSEEELATAAALRGTSPFKSAGAAAWPDAALTYESDEEELSPI